MRESDRQLYDEVARDNYGMEVCFDDIERDLSSLREGGAVTYNHLERIADESCWPFNKYWMWPVRERIGDALEETDGLLAELGDNLEREEEVIKTLLGIFRNSDLASILLRFVWPEDYGIYSRPPLFVLQTKRGRNAVGELLNYFNDLRLFRDTLHIERAADFEMIAWSVSYQKEKYIRNFKKSLAERLPEKFPVNDLIRFNRRDPLKLAVLLQQSGHFITACKWLGEAAEKLMKDKCIELKFYPDDYETLGDMIYKLETDKPDDPWYNRNRDPLKILIRLRNEATHNSKDFDRDQAERMFSIVGEVFRTTMPNP